MSNTLLKTAIFLAAFHRKSSPFTNQIQIHLAFSRFYRNSCLRATKSTWLSSNLPHTHTRYIQRIYIIINFVWWKGNHEQNTHNDDVVDLLTLIQWLYRSFIFFFIQLNQKRRKKSSKVNKIDLHVLDVCPTQHMLIHIYTYYNECET